MSLELMRCDSIVRVSVSAMIFELNVRLVSLSESTVPWTLNGDINMNMNFTRKDGKVIVMEPLEVPYALLTTMYRMQEDYASWGLHYTLDGVLRDIIGLGVDTKRTRVKWGGILKETKKIETSFKDEVTDILSNHKDMSETEKQALVGQLFMDTQKKIQETRNELRRVRK